MRGLGGVKLKKCTLAGVVSLLDIEIIIYVYTVAVRFYMEAIYGLLLPRIFLSL